MANHLHHTHLFASDIDATIAWWTGMLGAEVAVDTELAGARNVFLRLGEGRLHLYDQPPRELARNAVHHIGIRTDDLAALAATMAARGAHFRSTIRDFGAWKYLMCAAPDNVLLELFEADPARLDGALGAYFADATAA